MQRVKFVMKAESHQERVNGFNNVSRLTACREVVRSFSHFRLPPGSRRNWDRRLYSIEVSFKVCSAGFLSQPVGVIALRSDGVPENLVDVTGSKPATSSMPWMASPS